MNFIKKMTLTLIGATIIATNGIAQSVQHTTQGITYTTQEIDVKVEFYSPTIDQPEIPASGYDKEF